MNLKLINTDSQWVSMLHFQDNDPQNNMDASGTKQKTNPEAGEDGNSKGLIFVIILSIDIRLINLSRKIMIFVEN